jgi:hypothetical protein
VTEDLIINRLEADIERLRIIVNRLIDNQNRGIDLVTQLGENLSSRIARLEADIEPKNHFNRRKKQ